MSDCRNRFQNVSNLTYTKSICHFNIFPGPKTGLRKSAEKAKEADLQRNVAQVCKFVKALIHPNPKMHKVFQVTKKSIRPRLLKYIQHQASVEDDTTTQLTIDVFASQYDIEKHSVFMKTDDLLGLSNLLIEHENKLRLTENDEVRFLYHCKFQICNVLTSSLICFRFF